jgi:hypothetical protein
MCDLSLYDSGRITCGSAPLLASPSGYVRATGTSSTSAVAAGEGRTNGTSSQSSSDDHVGEAGLLASDRQTHPVGHLDVNLSPVPSFVRVALIDPNWCAPWKKSLRPLSPTLPGMLSLALFGFNIVTGKWIFKHNLNSDCSLERYKARWVLHDFIQ